jgi:GAF domain-containing protein/Sel1 repeat-containing protein
VFRMESPSNVRSERPAGERRRCVRQKIHTPAYARFDDNSELDQNVDLCLDLSETNCQVKTSANVVRLDASGRAAIRFAEMPQAARQQLKEWLFLNAMMAAANQSSAFLEPEPLTSEQTHSDFTSRLMALSAVNREVELLGADLDVALDLIASRALSFTSASGAAIALSQGIEMICVASAGSQAPPLDSRLQAGSGFSGECVRTGKLMRCDDSEENALVDRESCRALGIRSMIAAPIRRNGSVVGLLEVFSPRPMGLDGDAETVLTHLCETAMAAIKRAGFATIRSAAEHVPEPRTEPTTETAPFLYSHKAILIGAACAVVLAFTILLAAPWRKSAAISSTQAITQATPDGSPRAIAESTAAPSDLQSLMKLADQGDPAAQFAVGARYATGQDGQQDYAEAIRWFSRAAEQGHVVSQATLGAYYWAGRGVQPDIEKAYYWSILAQNAGDQASKYRVAVLKSRLTPTEISSVENRANDWMRSRRGISQASKREPIP